MKKRIAMALAGLMVISMMTGCGQDSAETSAVPTDFAQPIQQTAEATVTEEKAEEKTAEVQTAAGTKESEQSTGNEQATTAASETASTASATAMTTTTTDTATDAAAVTTETTTATATQTAMYTTPTPVDPASAYHSELTNELISGSIANQRPVAVMVDNEKTALPHYGVNSADIVYEICNSDANDRVTRLMCIFKDWAGIPMIGSIRSVRPTNIFTAAEYNAIVCHDGGPYYINEWVAQPYCDHISGGFTRVKNGKNWEFTEYITNTAQSGPTLGGGTTTYASLASRIASAGISTKYNAYYLGKPFTFSDSGYSLAGYSGCITASVANLSGGFKHNASKLVYNSSTGLYEYQEYGSAHIDAATGAVTSFKNVLILKNYYVTLDDHGYNLYYYNGPNATNQEGWYLTGGKAIPITWSKNATLTAPDITKYYVKATGETLKLNTGKTYIAFFPGDYWGTLSIQ